MGGNETEDLKKEVYYTRWESVTIATQGHAGHGQGGDEGRSSEGLKADEAAGAREGQGLGLPAGSP